LDGVTDRSRLIVAYEPIWAIGVGSTPAEPAEIRPVAAALRDFSGETPLLYGGSVNANSAPGYVRLPGIDGLFVGRAAWTPDGFANVLQAAAA
jgi:triosephosphate isomerase